MKQFSFTVLAAAALALFSAGAAWGQSFGPSERDFEKFIAQMAEMDKKSQFKLVRETLTEFYDVDCQVEKKRQVKRDRLASKWDFIVPGRAKRQKEDFGFRALTEKSGQGLVYLSKDETWTYGILYFNWDAQTKSWWMTGFKFDMNDAGDCI